MSVFGRKESAAPKVDAATRAQGDQALEWLRAAPERIASNLGALWVSVDNLWARVPPEHRDGGMWNGDHFSNAAIRQAFVKWASDCRGKVPYIARDAIKAASGDAAVAAAIEDGAIRLERTFAEAAGDAVTGRGAHDGAWGMNAVPSFDANDPAVEIVPHQRGMNLTLD